MDLIHLCAYAVGIIVVLGFIAWLMTQITMPAPFPNLIIGVCVFVAVLLLLRLFFPSFFAGFHQAVSR